MAPPIQILPSIPTFGSKLAEALGGATVNAVQGYQQRKNQKDITQLTEQLQNPNVTQMQKLGIVTKLTDKLGPERSKALLPLYAPFIYGQNSNQNQGVVPGQPSQPGVPQGPNTPITSSTAPTGVQNAPSPSGQTESEIEARKKELHNLASNPYYGDSAKEELKDIREKEKLTQKKDVEYNKQVEKSYDRQKEFIDNTTNQYKSFETDFKPRLLQMRALPDQDLVGPSAAKFLDVLGIPLGALENPSSELYQKLSQDLLKGLPETYGSRILKVEVDNFLKTIPQLTNSPDGRRMIASNMLKLGEMKETFYREMRRQQLDYLDNNKKFPADFEQRVFDNVKPEIDRINNEFVKLSEITSIPPNTVPFFNPQGEISFVPNDPKSLEWAAGPGGGRRIW